MLVLVFSALAINLMVRARFPNTPGKQSRLQLWQELHEFLSMVDEQALQEWNNDLVGLSEDFLMQYRVPMF